MKSLNSKDRVIVAFVLIGLLGFTVLRAIGLYLALFIVIGISGWLVYQYNSIQSLFQGIKESHSNIQVAMKKRLDLANKLMEIAANYADHETMTHLGVAKLESPAGLDGEDRRGILGSFQNFARNYPALQANETYQVLMDQLEDIEVGLQRRRETYNRSVREYNTSISTIPMVFVADSLGFGSMPYFDALAADEVAGLAEFKTGDVKELKSFLSGLGSQFLGNSGPVVDGNGGEVVKDRLEEPSAERTQSDAKSIGGSNKLEEND